MRCQNNCASLATYKDFLVFYFSWFMVHGWGKKKNNQSNSVDVINSGWGANGSHSWDALKSHPSHTPPHVTQLLPIYHTLPTIPIPIMHIKFDKEESQGSFLCERCKPTLGFFTKDIVREGGWEACLVESHICHNPWNVWLFIENFGSHNLRNIAN
jgi:hypothetical protein